MGELNTYIRREILRCFSAVSWIASSRSKDTSTHKKKRASMLEFFSRLSGIALNRRLADEELIRAVRMMIGDECEGVQKYV
jgi:hypothetical protein